MNSVVTGVGMFQPLLSLEVARPSAAICGVIAGLKDLCELQGGRVDDWRRGPGTSSPTVGRFQSSGPSNYRGNGRPVNNIPRTSSVKSFTSGDSPLSPSPSPSASPLSQAPVKYQSQFKNSLQPVEEKILNNIILSKLNKFSPSTYTEIRDFLYQILGSGDANLTQMICDFMQLVFKKAASEESYCALYAKLLSEISQRYKVILDEMHKLQEGYIDIFDEIVEVPADSKDYNAFVAKNREKRYRQGYSQFLSELVALDILELKNTEQTFRKIFSLIELYGKQEEKKSLVDEYFDCLLRMARVLKKKSGIEVANRVKARASILEISKVYYKEFTENKENYPSLTNKSSFILMDIYDILQGK
jgi:hypothetical protein